MAWESVLRATHLRVQEDWSVGKGYIGLGLALFGSLWGLGFLGLKPSTLNPKP